MFAALSSMSLLSSVYDKSYQMQVFRAAGLAIANKNILNDKQFQLIR